LGVFNVLATAGNFNNEIGLPMTLFGLDETHECAVHGNGRCAATATIKYLAEIATPTVGVVPTIRARAHRVAGKSGQHRQAQSRTD
jgi:UDP-N-acetylmuramoyl-tripeptide--D-alanyl-D-alanine ligase